MELMKRERARRRTRREWEQFIRQCDDSGLSAKQFCRQEGLAYASFIYWRGVIRKEPPTDVSAFVEIGAVGANDKPLSSQQWAVELSLGNGMVLRINPGS